MGRSTQRKAKENRDNIIHEAGRLFRSRGVDNVSVADIMAAAGLTVGGFYKHFASKDALVAETFNTVFDHSLSRWEMICDQRNAGIREGIQGLIEHYLSNSERENRCPVVAFAPHLACTTPSQQTRETYLRGTEQLMNTFVSEMPLMGSTEKSRHNALVMFAAVIGAQMLKQATGSSRLSNALETAIKSSL